MEGTNELWVSIFFTIGSQLEPVESSFPTTEFFANGAAAF